MSRSLWSGVKISHIEHCDFTCAKATENPLPETQNPIACKMAEISVTDYNTGRYAMQLKRTLQVVMSKRVMKRAILAHLPAFKKTPCKLVKNRRKSLVSKRNKLPDGVTHVWRAGMAPSDTIALAVGVSSINNALATCRGGGELVKFRRKSLAAKINRLPGRGI